MRQKSRTGVYSLPYTVRPERILFVFILVLGILISLPSLLILQRGSSAILPIIPTILIMCLLWGFIATWMLNIGSLKIVLLPDRICYHTLFSRQEKLFADITRTEIDRVMRKGFRMYQFVRAVQYILRIEDHFSDKPLLINTKPFSKRNLSIIIDAVATHAPSVTLDESVRQLREGTFTG